MLEKLKTLFILFLVFCALGLAGMKIFFEVSSIFSGVLDFVRKESPIASLVYLPLVALCLWFGLWTKFHKISYPKERGPFEDADNSFSEFEYDDHSFSDDD